MEYLKERIVELREEGFNYNETIVILMEEDYSEEEIQEALYELS